MKLSILVPFRDADGTRTRAKEWILRRWAHYWPDAEIVEAPDDGINPFNKSLAINNAAKMATGDIYAILDADTWVETKWVHMALDAIRQGTPWVVPCRRNMRLRQDVSEKLMARNPIAPLPPLGARDVDGAVGPVVGFLHIMPRAAFEAVGGYDERIRGWGGEDTSFTWAMDVVNGKHRQLMGTAMCLWHDRPRDGSRNRIWVGQDRRREQQKKAVVGAYTMALRTPGDKRAAMLKVLRRDPATPKVKPAFVVEPDPIPPPKLKWLEIRERRARQA